MLKRFFLIQFRLNFNTLCPYACQEECSASMTSLQSNDKEDLLDIRYNFAVGGDGNYYEARGKDKLADFNTRLRFDDHALYVVLLGSFREISPDDHLTPLKNLFKVLVAQETLSPRFKVIYELQLPPSFVTRTLYVLNLLPNFYKREFKFKYLKINGKTKSI